VSAENKFKKQSGETYFSELNNMASKMGGRASWIKQSDNYSGGVSLESGPDH
jgi:hypothetical protein